MKKSVKPYQDVKCDLTEHLWHKFVWRVFPTKI